MDETPLKSLELKQHKTDMKVKLAANNIWASSPDPTWVQKALISSIWKCLSVGFGSGLSLSALIEERIVAYVGFSSNTFCF